MSNTKQPRSRTRAKILDRVDADEDLREFVDETKQRLIMLGFIPPPQSSDWKESSAYIQHLGEEILESDREDDPVEELQQTVASILTKYNFDYKVKGNYVSKHNSRIRHRITDPHSVEQVLLHKNLVLLRCIMKITAAEDYEKVSKAIVCLFEANDKVGYLFEWLLKEEIDHHTKNAAINTLFREDSLRIKVLSNYFKLVGKHYLKRMLYPVIIEAKKPSKLSVNENGRHLADLLMDQLANETKLTCPDSIRVICEITKEETLKRTPHYLIIALGNLIFLRWISPALIQPDSYGITDESPTIDERRVLLQTAKLIQTAVNAICDTTIQQDEWCERMCARILSYLIRIPKRADELEFVYPSKNEKNLPEILEIYHEVKVLRDFQVQRLYRHVRLHIDEIEWVWKEVLTTPLPN